MAASIKGPGEARYYDGSNLRIAIVHARWNAPIITALVAGARKSLLAAGVKEQNIIIQDVPGSYELPFAVQRIYASSQIQSSTSPFSGPPPSATDLLSSSLTLTSAPQDSLPSLSSPKPSSTADEDDHSRQSPPSTAPFAAIIAIGVLIKGDTMHFEYIAEATSHGLMRVQLDSGVPVVFGLLTCLDEIQAEQRAGIGAGSHCHGEDWGRAAVELGVKRSVWGDGGLA